ncbi:MAG: BamA/TamA family outer membrane protein [Candidatus Lambdaproteobacteria bacterium]|nr:BamA/TamA family outer membrane protein [Candidatus Lambdaproteobacteria bacterium]
MTLPSRSTLVPLVLAVLVTLLPAATALAEVTERRKSQFPSEPGYMVLPLPYSLPGIGEGVFVTAFASNIRGTYTDAWAVAITGDAEGVIVGAEDIHLIRETLILNLFEQRIDRAAVRSYTGRGMATSKTDYRLLEVSKVDAQGGRLSWTADQRRFELFAEIFAQAVQLDRVRKPNGELIAEFTEPNRSSSRTQRLGVLVDRSDDYYDPRRGYRLGVDARYSPRQNSDAPDFYVVNLNAFAYVPLGRISTLALNLFRSDAVVNRSGDIDPVSVRQENDLHCGGNAECQAAEDALVNNALAANRHGNAASLGGSERLRAYPGDRFNGAHSLYLGAELRWNLTEEFTPFDYLVWKDVRTGIQIAMFAETGSVADTVGELGRVYRSSMGAGLRMVTASGLVYRADVANGPEGSETSIIVNYPW